MADEKKLSVKCSTQLSSEPETDARQSDRNHPSGAIPRTQQGSVQHDRSFTSYEDSGIHRSEEYSQTEDREKAEAYKDHLNNDIITKSGKCIKAVLFDDAELESLAGSKFAHLEKAFERCTFAFVYLTKEFCENDDGWCRVSSEECLMKAIYDKEKSVPVYTVQRNKANFKIPMGLNALKGINYYNNDEFYRRGLTKLLESKLFVRQNNEKNHREKILQEIKITL
ncbi:LOW QUALITY PROTEIN: hypothetical protein KUTeg_018117 [Tegillarca granosa]|uniref:TIR domain-containing protein n=1 Tax=Tegillarca granosa TaxID=220873 RepID=A0ABQ9EGV5_TEGGR|nr:LOW QUALITY PROTEIN: hypothetical protein KUTeg_018117 [Tegillarca granosa]